MNRFELPQGPGSYRWYYLDLTSGDFTAVVIFMVGSIFSPRYSTGVRRGARPVEHSAVNFALYQKGVRCQWVLSEYQQVRVEDEGRTLKIGGSSMRYERDGRLVASIAEQTPLWGESAEAQLELTPEGPGHTPIRLVEGLDHWWQPIAPHARASLRLPAHELSLEGRGYHDGNHGEVPLGSDLRGWDWVRTHHADSTTVTYRPWHPESSAERPAWQLRADPRSLELSRSSLVVPPSSRTGWGLKVPSALEGKEDPVLLESSPFYARLEAEAGGEHALGEVADFQRFHSPWIRWMAGLRTRVVRHEEHPE